MTKKEAISILRKWRNIGEKDMTSERLGYIEGWFHEYDAEAFEMAIESLEHTPCYLDSPCEYQNPDIKIPPQTDWIPVTERLPDKENKKYVVTLDDGEVENRWWLGCFWVESVGRVVAWMPLPEPYKEGAEDETD